MNVEPACLLAQSLLDVASGYREIGDLTKSAEVLDATFALLTKARDDFGT